MYPLLSFFIVLAALPCCIRIAHRFGLYDEPDHERKIHTGRIPYTGGFAIVIGYSAAVAALFIFDWEAIALGGQGRLIPMFIYLAEAAIIVLLLGIFDDLRDLPFQRKFLFQFTAAFFVILGAIRSDVFPIVFNMEQSGILVNSAGTLLSVLWIVGSTNAVNMIDGMDGLAGGASLISAAALGILALIWSNPLIAVLLFALAGALLAFLIFNFNPARIFMGDTGSMFIGFVLGVLGWLLIDGAPMKSTVLFVPVIVLGLPIFDTLLAFIRRLIKRQNPFAGDRFHMHHMLKKRFSLSTRAAVSMLYLLSAAYAGFGILIAILPELEGWLLIGLLAVLHALLLHVLGYTDLLFQPGATIPAAVGELVKSNGAQAHPRNGSAVKPSRAASSGVE